MDLSPGPLIASLVVGTLGFGLFLYGKKAERWPHMVTGSVLMVFPYFVSSVLLMLAVAALVVGGFALALRNGL